MGTHKFILLKTFNLVWGFCRDMLVMEDVAAFTWHSAFYCEQQFRRMKGYQDIEGVLAQIELEQTAQFEDKYRQAA